MPSNSKTLSDWYLQMAQHLEAGIPIANAWNLSGKPAGKACQRAVADLQSGSDLADVIERQSNWLPTTDRVQIIFAANRGQLPETCRRLAERHRQLAEMTVRIKKKLLYPIFVFHGVAVVLPLIHMLNFETGLSELDFKLLVTQVLLLIMPIWLIIGIFYLASKTTRPLLSALLCCAPYLRGYAYNQAMADFCEMLGSAVGAGIPLHEAWRQAGKASRYTPLIKTGKELEAVFRDGRDPTEVIDRIRCLPKDFISYYKTGSTTGKLDQMMLQLGRDYTEKAQRKLSTATAFYPGIALLSVAGLVVYSVFGFFSSYVDLLDSFKQ